MGAVTQVSGAFPFNLFSTFYFKKSLTFCSYLISYLLDNFFFCRIWDVKTGSNLNVLCHHNEAVLHLRFQNGIMVTWQVLAELFTISLLVLDTPIFVSYLLNLF